MPATATLFQRCCNLVVNKPSISSRARCCLLHGHRASLEPLNTGIRRSPTRSARPREGYDAYVQSWASGCKTLAMPKPRHSGAAVWLCGNRWPAQCDRDRVDCCAAKIAAVRAVRAAQCGEVVRAVRTVQPVHTL